MLIYYFLGTRETRTPPKGEGALSKYGRPLKFKGYRRHIVFTHPGSRTVGQLATKRRF